MENRKLSAKEILADIRAEMTDSDLMEKYQLSEKTLQSVFKKLVDTGIIKQEELDNRPKKNPTLEFDLNGEVSAGTHEADASKPKMCPKCGKEYFDESQVFCAHDGFKLIRKYSGNACPKCGAQVDNEAGYCGKCGIRLFGNWDYSNESDYYRAKFDEFERNQDSFKPTWNWAAFFLFCIWYLAKGLWGKALLLFILALVLGGLTIGIGDILLWIYAGMFGNYDYYLLKKKNTQWWG